MAQSAYRTPTQHQAYQNFPKLDSRFVDVTDGTLALPWYQFLITLWRRTGCSTGPTNTAGNIQIGSGTIGVYDVNGNLIGTIPLGEVSILNSLAIAAPQDVVDMAAVVNGAVQRVPVGDIPNQAGAVNRSLEFGAASSAVGNAASINSSLSLRAV